MGHFNSYYNKITTLKSNQSSFHKKQNTSDNILMIFTFFPFYFLTSIINLSMFIDKNISNPKVLAKDKTPKQIQQVITLLPQIQQESIDHIRSISQELYSLMDQLQDLEPSMMSLNASPINKKKKGQHSRVESRQEDFIGHSFLKSRQKSKQSEEFSSKMPKKLSVPSVHYASYMKPTHNLKEKVRDIMIEQRQKKIVEEQSQRREMEKLKKASNKHYPLVESRYQKYHEAKGDKEEAIANRQLQKQFSQMSGVTFKPQINKNVPVNESFEQRLESNKYRKQIKEGEVIKDMIKNHTYKPKINIHKPSQSKIKKIWSENCFLDDKSKSSQQLSLYPKSLKSSPVQMDKSNYVKMDLQDCQFMISENLFD